MTRHCFRSLLFILFSFCLFAATVHAQDTSSTTIHDAASAAIGLPATTGEQDLSPLGLYRAAQPVVQGIVLVLLMCSVLTWTICIVKAIQFYLALRHVRREQQALQLLESLADCRSVIRGWGTRHAAVRLLQEVDEEVHRSCHFIDSDLKGRIEYRLERKVNEHVQHLRFGIGPLATIGSVTPFIGLFGTVWGIMHSFIGIANAKTVSLAVVAPGIAEALFATAVGLVAAIPAVVLYNFFLRGLNTYQFQVGNVAALLFLQVRRGVCANRSILDREEGIGPNLTMER